MKILYKNTLSGAGQLLLTASLTFFSIPVFIHTLGEEAYGAFSIVTLAGNLNIFASLGLNTALLRFLSAQGKSRESDFDIAITMGLLLVIILPLSALALNHQNYILQHLLGLSDALYSQVVDLYQYVLIANVLLLLGQTFTTVLDAQQRMYLTNFYQLIYSVLYWGGILVAVSVGFGMNELGLVVLGSAAIWFGLVAVAAWQTWGWLKLGGLRHELPQVVRKQISFSSKVYAAGLLTMLFEPITKILVARLIGVREVGYLEIAYKVRSQLGALTTRMIYPIFPKIVQETDPRRLSQLLGNYQTGMVLVLLPFLFFFTLVVPDLLLIWLPNASEIVITATLCISVTFILNSLSLPPYYFLMSRQHVGKTVLIQVTNVVVNLVVGLLTYQLLGVYGFVLGNCVAILASMGLCLHYQRRLLGELVFLQMLPVLLIMLMVGLPVVAGGAWLTTSWLRIGAAGLATLLMYALILRRSFKSFKSVSPELR